MVFDRPRVTANQSSSMGLIAGLAGIEAGPLGSSFPGMCGKSFLARSDVVKSPGILTNDALFGNGKWTLSEQVIGKR